MPVNVLNHFSLEVPNGEKLCWNWTPSALQRPWHLALLGKKLDNKNKTKLRKMLIEILSVTIVYLK